MSYDMQTLIAHAKNKGFIYQGSEIYGGLANSWDYGPLGIMLKEQIKTLWQKELVQKRRDMTLLDAAIMMNPQVWVASGHVGSFSDPLMECRECHTRHRADKLVEEMLERYRTLCIVIANIFLSNDIDGINSDKNPFGAFQTKNNYKNDLDALNGLKEYIENKEIANNHHRKQYIGDINELINIIKAGKPKNWSADKTPNEDFNAYMQEGHIACPNCGAKNWTDIQRFNLMLSTHQGVTEDSSSLVYLRPETAQGIFVNFANIARTTRKKIPFGVAQCGKAFRNEITPKNAIFRTREFEQIEIEYFCEPGTDGEHFEKWLLDEEQFFTQSLGLTKEKVRFVEIPADGLPHYSKRAGDFEYLFPFGWGEISTLANRTDYDLKAHMGLSKQDLSYFDPFTNQKYVPYVIEPSIGLSRLTLALMADAYTEVENEEGSRVIMKFAPQVAPIKVAILPLVKKLSEKAIEIFDLLSPHMQCEYDETGTIGKRYHRMDEIGVPFSICIDFDHTENGEVTIRHRDSGEQDVVRIDELVTWLKAKGC